MAKTDPEIRAMRAITVAMEAVMPGSRARLARIMSETTTAERAALAEIVGAVAKVAKASEAVAGRVVEWTAARYGG